VPGHPGRCGAAMVAVSVERSDMHVTVFERFGRRHILAEKANTFSLGCNCSSTHQSASDLTCARLARRLAGRLVTNLRRDCVIACDEQQCEPDHCDFFVRELAFPDISLRHSRCYDAPCPSRAIAGTLAVSFFFKTSARGGNHRRSRRATGDAA
jgi:hypothetical protein